MKTWILLVAVVGVGILGIWLSLGGRHRANGEAAGGGVYVVAGSEVEAGWYLILAGGCNDCHTPGFMQRGMEMPESEWLTGVPVGWKGPWGTTYASNLRLTVEQYTEDAWVGILRKRNARPPMVWTAVNAMSERDLRAVYKYIKSLGVKGERMPDAAMPGEEPGTAYLVMEPVMPKGAAK